MEASEAKGRHDSSAGRADCIFGDFLALHVLLQVFQSQSSGTTVVCPPNVALEMIFSPKRFETDFAGWLKAWLSLVMGTHLNAFLASFSFEF